ncbi:UNVERIFIED_CONTAM: hypothetical protein Slati_3769100 [Sesamum latifolium]|uniref:RNase H type-1 domain-containing protein n=1 Tax=Sesamum latifolium TaxID=2727402 RepID=A0AAW2U4E1_9LAMI
MQHDLHVLYLWTLYKPNGFKAVHWRGDLLVAKRIGFTFHSTAEANPILCHWLPPPHGIWKLNCDGASKSNLGPSGAGGLIRDSRGRMLLAFYDFVSEHTNTFAELYAVNRGLHLAWQNGYRNIWVELDASAVLWIILTERGDWRFQSLLTSIRRLKRKMNIHFTYVYREANQPADFLANCVCNLLEDAIIPQAHGLLASLIKFDILFPSFRFCS